MKLLLILLLLMTAGCDVTDDDEDEPSTGEPVASSDACGLLGLTSRVIGGTECGSLFQSPVVRISRDSDTTDTDPGDGFCTGTMITSDDVVTAAHCFLGGVRNLVVSFGDPGDTTEVRAASIRIHPQFSPLGGADDRATFDIAVISLESPINVPVLPVLISQGVSSGSTVGVFGYGQTVVGDPAEVDIPAEALDFEELFAGEMVVQGVSEFFYLVENTSGTNVCFGDSGGPLVYQLNGTSVNLGVVSQGSVVSCDSGDVTSFTNLSNPDVASFILQEVPDAAIR